MDALIGYTGFVGGNIKAQAKFSNFYNSKNITEIDGKSFDLVVCSAAPAEKWRANQEPDKDWSNLEILMHHLKKIKAKEFVLISTVDVYPDPVGVDEKSAFNPKSGSSYGYHRYMLERFCDEQFDALIVRLPGLFGNGIKKNAIYDFLHDNNLDQIDAEGIFQFYYLDHLWRDMEIARKNKLKLLNVATEPVSIKEVAKEGFGLEFSNKVLGKKPAKYNFRSQYDYLYGGKNGYLYSKKQVLSDLRRFVSREKGK